MSTPDAARIKYATEYDQFCLAAQEMKKLLDIFVREQGIRASAVEVRAKSIASFVKKIYIRSYKDSWVETTDKVGARVIVKTLDDLDNLCAALKNTSKFELLCLEDKAELASEDKLFYPGIHAQLVVPDVKTLDGERIECEVQLRTKAQDLWSVPSHELLYKGVIKPSKATRRRLLRLSVLTEMFDEEVRRAMHEIASDPNYELALLLREAEALYLSFAAEPGDEDLSLEVLSTVVKALPTKDRFDYPTTLQTFVDTNQNKLANIFKTYGATSKFHSEYPYLLFSQPEAIIVFERINHAPLALAEAVSSSEMREAVRWLYIAWGSPMPEIV